MTKLDKLRQKIKNGQDISFEEAQGWLIKMGFQMRAPGSSHFVFWKEGYNKTISLKKRSQLYPYQIQLLQEVIKFYEQD